jgi:cholesterol transport system auxiliary component
MMFSKISGIRIFALPLVMALGACVSFGGKAPPSMLVLTSDNIVSAGSARLASSAETLVIQTPSVPRKLDTNRIPVQINSSSIAYVKDAFWADKPARLMQSLLVETLSAKTGNLVLNEVDAGGKATVYLSGSLLEFGIDAATNEAIIVYDAVKIARNSPAEKRRFEARRPVSVVAAAQAGEALNAAANDVAVQIAAWTN